MRGLFVTFEGGEGSGKTTQLKLLANRIRASGQEVIESHDPGGTGIGKEIRTLLLDPGPAPISAATELLLYEASRAQLVRELIAPALARGTIVLCDRFTDSTVAYQGCGRGIDRDLIRQLNRFATDGLVPDLTILLDLDPEIGLARCGRDARPDAATGRGTGSAGWDRIEAEPLDFHRRVRDGYLALAREEPDRVAVIDAGLDTIEIEAIVWNRIVRLQSVQRCRFMTS
ncbi:thymidylate kinase [Candidatus Methylomirabilis lanthanidiphila]|uniref:Thymidylate kinase n=1 Tax=Candidatus Methylomirabilis lanthanidiphila TaxID=2211376 RepID=A0A564ZES2_9BACT|nr:dTMP kinase [Candidatus Methylomirabilis lanthanidiphila]VUZ83811.1 thymidylate kinase [Candidatus Methylomirabilis lanthanidiphila]